MGKLTLNEVLRELLLELNYPKLSELFFAWSCNEIKLKTIDYKDFRTFLSLVESIGTTAPLNYNKNGIELNYKKDGHVFMSELLEVNTINRTFINQFKLTKATNKNSIDNSDFITAFEKTARFFKRMIENELMLLLGKDAIIIF